MPNSPGVRDAAIGVRGGIPSLTALIFAGMGAGTFTLVSLGILATFIIEDLGISRTQLGLVIGADTLIAAAFSPYAGRVADRLGGRRSLIGLFLVAALSWLVYSQAPVFGLMFAGALLGGIAEASCNPATNRMIVERLPAGSRGMVTGIKQSGVQAGVFIGGLTLPSMAVAMGWRTTYVVVASLPIAFALATAWLVSPEQTAPGVHRTTSTGRLPSSIWWLAGYGLLFGFAGAASLLVPLFVEDGLGQDARIAGLVTAAIGLVAVGGRVAWARYSERTHKFIEPLWAMTPLGMAGAGLFLLADSVGVWLVWPAAICIGLSTSSWNGVAMLAAMDEAGPTATGRASGIIVAGFLLGLGLGPPAYGAMVDATDSYDPMWWASGGAALATAILVGVWLTQQRRERAALGEVVDSVPMGTTVAFANQKGGVAKTTTVHSLAEALVERDHTVLMVDLDPQACLTYAAGIDPDQLDVTLHDVLLGRSKAADAIVTTDSADLLPSSIDVAGAEVHLLTKTGREFVLSRALKPLKGGYDAVLVDCGPSLGILTINGLTAADGVVIPFQCETLSHRGVGQLLETVDDVRNYTNDDLAVIGGVATMYDGRTRLAHEVLASVAEIHGLEVLDPPIPKSVRVAEAPGKGRSVLRHAPHSKPAIAYRELAANLEARL